MRRLDAYAYKALKQATFAAQGMRCHYCRRLRHLDLHHVIKRSQGGPDAPENVVGLCRSCHDRTDWPWSKGRLVFDRHHDGFTGSIAYSEEPA